jgi:asparagine synthase (glutamine-hydrolysing)
MCGFVAAFSFNKSSIDHEKLIEMANVISHRGPDNQGTFKSDWFGMVFNRLSIIDTSISGHQPMVISDSITGNKFVCIFNGEIYNFEYLRNKLQKHGYTFLTDSDTEVLIYSYLMWGEKCVEQFIGMFSFIIVDLTKNTVFAARDHLGIKPLYFANIEGTLFFVSEIKALSLFNDFSLNKNKVLEQIAHRYIPGKETIFNEVKRIVPGSYVKFEKDGELHHNIYYDVSKSIDSSNKNKIDRNVEYPKIANLLNKSIIDHTRSDVGYNVQLSGGVDSSYIVSILKENNLDSFKTYSVVVDENSEAEYQNKVVNKYSLNHNAFSFSNKDLADVYIKATWHFDLPIIHSVCPFLMLLSLESSKSSKVILTGEGADELLLGYSRHIKPNFMQLVTIYLNRILKKNEHLFNRIKHFKTINKIISYDPGMNTQNGPNLETARSVLINPIQDFEFRQSVSQNQNTYLSKIIAADQTSYLQGLLERQDKMSMAYSVESRVPFANPALFEYINKISINAKLYKGIQKYILKKISSKYYDHFI